ncbi:MAG: type II toxin-antitoxin system prevent-host-death family antitoxin [Streptosporangiaceae bacterium]|jgi:antitoxin (DNA-binding transcriptional repressor) of toxin-antitoxin stability system
MAVMTVSEARAALPEVLTRVAQGEEITITRYGSPIAVVVRPDIVWSRPRAEVIMDETVGLVRILRERAKRHGRSLEQELRSILDAAGSDPEPAPLPPIRLATVRTAGSSSWSREEIYGDEGR